jgi:hypothetical protein
MMFKCDNIKCMELIKHARDNNIYVCSSDCEKAILKGVIKNDNWLLWKCSTGKNI